MPEPVRRRMTYAELQKLPDDGMRHELIDGRLIMSPSPFLAHQLVVQRIHITLYNWVTEHRLGLVLLAPFDVIFDDFNVTEPDLLFVSRSRYERIQKRGVKGAPDLAIEVLSKGTARIDRGAKARTYATFGVSEYWLVDPQARTIQVLVTRRGQMIEDQLASKDQSFRSNALSGFEAKASLLFQDLDEFGQ